MSTVRTCKNTCVQSLVGKTLVPWLVVAAVLFASPDVAAQQIIRAEGGRVSVAADGVPLQKVLDRFAELVELKVWVRHGVGERVVTVAVEPLPAAVALSRVLLSAGVDFVISGDGTNQPIRLVVGDSKGPEAAAVLTGAADPPVVEAVNEPEEGGVGEKPEKSEEDRANQAEAIEAGTRLGPVIPPGFSPEQRLVQLLAPPPRAKVPLGAPIALPFPGPDGQLYTVQNVPPPPGIARFPFPGVNGAPLEVVVPPPKPGVFTLPFLGPDGQPHTVPAAPVPVPGRSPGGP
jgi:hypothetical protein